MNDHFESLDSTVRAIRAECEGKISVMQDQLVAAQIEAKLCREALARAQDDKAYAEGVAHRLIENFDIAERAFAKAKEYAVQIPAPKGKTDLPEVSFANEGGAS